MKRELNFAAAARPRTAAKAILHASTRLAVSRMKISAILIAAARCSRSSTRLPKPAPTAGCHRPAVLRGRGSSHVSGTDFLPGEIVTGQPCPGYAGHGHEPHSRAGDDDPNGRFVATWQVCATDCVGEMPGRGDRPDPGRVARATPATAHSAAAGNRCTPTWRPMRPALWPHAANGHSHLRTNQTVWDAGARASPGPADTGNGRHSTATAASGGIGRHRVVEPDGTAHRDQELTTPPAFPSADTGNGRRALRQYRQRRRQHLLRHGVR
jgi:hypothetical protein